MTRPAPVPQRLTLVLPSTGEFDSRTYRIASALAARGHAVTVLARLGPGTPADETHPAGYRIRRVRATAADGLPLPAPVREALARRRGAAGGSDAMAEEAAPAGPPTPSSGATVTGAGRTPARRDVGAAAARARRVVGGLWRIPAMALVVRAQAQASRALDEGADVYHGMAYMGIPVALGLAARHPGARVVYDARDIYVDAGNLARLPAPVRRVVGAAERRWARRAGRVATVNRPYAEVMAARWQVPLPVIALNCSYRYQPARPRARRFHERFGLSRDQRVVLYQGGFSPDRGIEQLIEALPQVPGATLVLMGYGRLRARIDAAAADPALGGRVRVMDAVPPTELLDWVASADVVAMPIQPTTLNHRLTTPNKLLEAMATGVPVVASDLPGMADIVLATGCGVLCDPRDPASVAAALRTVLDAPDGGRAMGERALAAAHGEFNWETQMGKLLDAYTDLTGRPW